jgi:hypothetical protein
MVTPYESSPNSARTHGRNARAQVAKDTATSTGQARAFWFARPPTVFEVLERRGGPAAARLRPPRPCLAPRL